MWIIMMIMIQLERLSIVIVCLVVIRPLTLTKVEHISRFGPHSASPIGVPFILDVKYLLDLGSLYIRLISNLISFVDKVFEVY
jgi:hypothetical protein